jgi:hypothetical protein
MLIVRAIGGQRPQMLTAEALIDADFLRQSAQHLKQFGH